MFMLTFSASDVGNSQILCADVPIIDDMLGNEPNEQFSVQFVSSEPFGIFDPTSEVCVTIEDDDSKLM